MLTSDEIQYGRLSPATMAKVSNRGRYRIADHIQRINRKLLEVASGQCKRLLVCMPPRHGKSMLISEHLPPWYLGRFPNRKILLSSYEATIAANWGRKCRETYKEYARPMFGTEISKTMSRSDWWETIAGGGMSTAGVGGPATGKGAHVFVIDDPVKNSQEAHSQKIRDSIYDWYLSVAFTRLESDPEGSVIIIMTRWHEDDLVGRLLKEGGTKDKGGEWDTLILPAIDDYGTPLFPERFSLERLRVIEKTLGPYYWNALYQQRPSSRDGAVINSKWFRKSNFFRPEFGVRFWDMAVTIQTSSDYCAGALCSMQEEYFVIHDIDRDRYKYPELKRRIIEHAMQDGPNVIIAVEDAGQQRGFIDDLARLPELQRFTVLPVKPVGDKYNRTLPWASRAQLATVFVCDGNWNQEFFDECDAFTSTDSHEHDDQIDAVSGAYYTLADQSGRGIDVYQTLGYGKR